LKLQGKDKLFLSLVNDVSAFKMKLKLFISQLEKKGFEPIATFKRTK